MVELLDFVPIIAPVSMDINIFAYTICMSLMFTLTVLYILEWLIMRLYTHNSTFIHGYQYCCLHYLLFTNVYFNNVVLA